METIRTEQRSPAYPTLATSDNRRDVGQVCNLPVSLARMIHDCIEA